jgi:hypothetical protein
MSGKDVANAIKGIVTSPSNIKGMWAFDARQGSIITDLSGNSHNITLRSNALAAIDASACSPGVVGSAPYLTFDATHVWNIPDHNDFSLTDGLGTDIAGTWIWSGAVSDMTNSTLFAKYDTGAAEYIVYFNASDKIAAILNSTHSTLLYIGRLYNTALTTYQNQFITVIVTYDGSEASTGIKIYFLGSRIDDTDFNTGLYIGMENTAATIASYYQTVTAPLKAKVAFQAFIKGEEITQAQVTSISTLLQRYAGVAA